MSFKKARSKPERTLRALVEQNLLREGEKIHGNPDRSDPRLTVLEYDARNLADTILRELPEGVGFTLFLYDSRPNGWMTYLSNGSREDMLRMIGAWLVREVEKEKRQ